MTTSTKPTLLDVQLAGVYYPVLVERARQKRTITYGELVAEVKKRFPEKTYTKSALAVSAGRRLDVVRQFTNENNLPDVTSLTVNKANGECGRGFTDSFNPEVVRKEVFARDWSEVKTDFDEFLDMAETAAVQKAKPQKRMSRNTVLGLIWEYYKEHKDLLPASITGQREKIIQLVMGGYSVADAYADVHETRGEFKSV